MAGEGKVLVYHHGANGAPTIPKGLAVVSEQELDDILSSNTRLQATCKEISRGATSVDIYQHDLLTDAQQAEFAKYPNYDANVANVKMPLRLSLGKALTGASNQLVILSTKR